MKEKAAVIDLGSNSLKMVIFVINPDNTYKPYQIENSRVKLGDRLTETGFLSEEAMERTLKTLSLFRDIINIQGIKHVLPVTTSAVREAGNRQKFLDEIKKKTGFNFRILSEEEEAVFSYVGAIRSLRLPSVLFFDIGGGSLEIVHVQDYEIKKIMSLPLGALRLTQMFSESDGSYKEKNYSKLQSRILDLIPFANELNLSKDTILVGVGGTLRAIAKYHQSVTDYPLIKVHNYSMKYTEILAIESQLQGLKPEKISKFHDISLGRSETIIAGTCVISLLMKALNFTKITISAQGLREGTLALSLENPSEFSRNTFRIEKIQSSIKFSYDPDILPPRIEDLVIAMLNHNKIDENDRIIIAQTVRQLPKSSEYRDLDNLLNAVMEEDSSLTHREQLISALSLIYNKKRKKAEKMFLDYNKILQKDDLEKIKKISLFVTLSDILEKTNTRMKITTNGDLMIFEIYPKSSIFPEILFKEFCQRFENLFSMRIQLKMTYSRKDKQDKDSIQL